MGACNAVIHSNRFDQTYEWLLHHTKMGVEGFRIYYTNQTVQWDGSPALVKSSADTFNPLNFPLVSWVQFDHLSLEDRFYFSQQTLYNECVYRLRHQYEYLLMFDIDEFLIIRDSRYLREGGLKSLLHHTFPPNIAAIGIYRYAYRDDCQGDDSIRAEAYHERFTHRLKDTESQSVLASKRYADKLIIKPEYVDVFYMHFVASVRSGYIADTINTQPTVVFLKHLRKYGESCSDLTQELPFDQD